jgi:hypothetical protein
MDLAYVKTVTEVARACLYISLFSILMTATFAPTAFGGWLQKIDNGRFEYLDCDCTEAYDDAAFYAAEDDI